MSDNFLAGADGSAFAKFSTDAVRPDGAFHQWREVPPRELSIALVADERFGRAIDWIAQAGKRWAWNYCAAAEPVGNFVCEA